MNRYIGVFAPEVKKPECADAAVDWSRNCRDHVVEYGLGPNQHRFRSIRCTPRRNRFDDAAGGIIREQKTGAGMRQFVAAGKMPRSTKVFALPSAGRLPRYQVDTKNYTLLNSRPGAWAKARGGGIRNAAVVDRGGVGAPPL